MSRFYLLVIVVVVLGSGVEARAQFQNARARKAAEAYKKAMDEARKVYIKELERAIREERKAGDLDEVKQLSLEKSAFEKNAPFFEEVRQLENTDWIPASNPKGFLRFLPGHQTVNHSGTKGVWIMPDKNTAITQSYNGGNIYVFKFGNKLESATVHTFENSNESQPYQKR